VRILVLSDSYPPHNLGGAGEVAHLVSKELAARGHEVMVATAVTRASLAGPEVQGEIRVHRIWSPVPSALRLHLSVMNPPAMAQIGRLAREFCPEIVHAHNVHERLSYGALGAARAGGAPLVLTAHDYLLFCLTKFLCSDGQSRYAATPSRCAHCRHIRRVPARNRLVHHLVRRNVASIACISQAQRTVLTANGFADVPLEVVYNGIDPQVPRASAGEREAFRRRHGIDERPLVLFGGRISGAKGGDQLLRAMVRVRRRIDAQLAILGDRQMYLDHARRLASEVGLEQSALHTVGWLNGLDLELAFAAADVCTTPSVYPDPFNLMNLRAMAHAKPVVGTCYGGTPEIVVDEETGYIADPWQPEVFGDRIADLLTQPDISRCMGQAGRTRLETSFTLERQVAGYLALFERVQRRAPRSLNGNAYTANGG
jgi:glycosyltransferase involved in cell wall biosynthesis